MAGELLADQCRLIALKPLQFKAITAGVMSSNNNSVSFALEDLEAFIRSIGSVARWYECIGGRWEFFFLVGGSGVGVGGGGGGMDRGRGGVNSSEKLKSPLTRAKSFQS